MKPADARPGNEGAPPIFGVVGRRKILAELKGGERVIIIDRKGVLEFERVCFNGVSEEWISLARATFNRRTGVDMMGEYLIVGLAPATEQDFAK